MSTRQDVFRAACEQLAFATESTDPAADLEAVGLALQLVARDLAGRPADQQRALILAASWVVDERKRAAGGRRK